MPELRSVLSVDEDGGAADTMACEVTQRCVALASFIRARGDAHRCQWTFGPTPLDEVSVAFAWHRAFRGCKGGQHEGDERSRNRCES